MTKNFWNNLKSPIIGLAPMDGVTDAAFRYMVAKHGKPSYIMTEFVNVEGLARGATKMLPAFIYNEMERPIIAQIFGVEVESFYKATVMLCALGFDGVDINMGCPVKKVAVKGSGAGLIKNPKLAREIIFACKKAASDWAKGISMEKAGVHERIIKEVKKINKERGGGKIKRKEIPISVKTRIGYDKDVAEDWVKEIVKGRPAAITMHGRTLKQMYGGLADWNAIKRAAVIAQKEKIIFIGNGDVKSMKDGKEKIKKYGVDGVLVGRAALGNPWFFSNKTPEIKDRFKAILEHCKYFDKILKDKFIFGHIKKHLSWYCKNFPGAKELRMKLMLAESTADVKKTLSEF